MKYFDVIDRSELPPPSEGFRYLDFIGGTKEIRCFLVPFDLPRAQFVKDNEILLDTALHAIYSNEGICIRQDASFALPGFYILSFLRHYSAIDAIDEITNLRLFFLLREIRKGMRNVLDIPFIHIYYEEKPAKSCNVHYWMLPINTGGQEKHPIIYDLKIKEYLNKFKFSKEREKIINFNEKMRQYIKEIKLLEKDNKLNSILKNIF